MGVSPPSVPCAAAGRPNGPHAANPPTPATLAATSARLSPRPTPALSMRVVLRAAVERLGSRRIARRSRGGHPPPPGGAAPAAPVSQLRAVGRLAWIAFTKPVA